MQDKIRVLRVLEYVGDRKAIEECLKLSIQGQKDVSGTNGSYCIKAGTIGLFPEILKAEISDEEKNF